ncbi:MAG: N-acetyltransferase family protein [Halanaeroarchaeum sp.]
MNVRRAGGGDVEGIRRVAQRSWETDYPDILTRETITDGVEEWYSTESVRADLGNPQSKLLVAEMDDEIVGFVQGHHTDEIGTILRVYVDPDHRRSGVGSALFEAASEALREAGADRIRAMALAKNERGCAFYRSQNMEQIATGTTTIGGERHEEAVFELEEDS